MTALPWIVYTRVSTEDQAQGGVSLDAQLTSCRAYCVARGWTVAEEVTDAGASATTLKRNGIQRVIAELKTKKIAGVVAWRLDRFTRSVRDLLTLIDLAKAQDVGLVSVSESLDTTTPMGRFVVHLLGAMAQWESETIGSRTKAAMDHARAQGYWMGRAIPAGCNVVPDGARKRLVRNAEADTVATAWPAVLAGKSLRDVCEDFKAKGIKPTTLAGIQPSGWTPAGVRHLLLSRQVIGLLVDSSTQLLVKKTLSERESPGRRRTSAKKPGTKAVEPSPLAGIIRCPACSAAFVQVTATGAGGTAYRFFRCTAKVRGKCQQKDLRCEPIEEEARLVVVAALAEGSEYLTILRAEEEKNRANIGVLRAERASLTSEREQLSARIEHLTLKTQIGTPQWNEAMRVTGKELERIDDRQATLAGFIAAAEVDEAGLEFAIENQRKGLAAVARNEAKDTDLAAIYRAIIHQITVTETEVIVELYRPAGAGGCSYNVAEDRPRSHGVRTLAIRCPRKTVNARK